MSEAPLRSRTSLLGLWLVLILGGVAGTTIAVQARLARRAAPPVLGTLPSFTLVDSSGAALTPQRLAGRPYVASFIFTRCAGACPLMTARLSRLRPKLPRELRFVSFTVDPQHDTPERLAAYARAHGAAPPDASPKGTVDNERGGASPRRADDWLFGTGTREALHALSTQGFKLAAYEVPPGEQKAGGDGPFLHSPKFVLVDGGGRVRGYYDSADDAEVAALERDARALLGAGS